MESVAVMGRTEKRLGSAVENREDRGKTRVHTLPRHIDSAGIMHILKENCADGDILRHPTYGTLEIRVREPYGKGGGKVFEVFRDERNQGPSSENVAKAIEIYLRCCPKY